LGVPDAKFDNLANFASDPAFSARERLALDYAERMTITGRDVDDATFERLRAEFSDDELVELTATIAWENSSSKFNRALRVESQGLWTRAGAGRR
jgi:alkylhydroperoxidase family enzyme